VNTEDSESDTFDNPWSHFEGLGLGAEVPVYLRTTGKVQNLRYSKKETELFLNEIWIAKEQYEAHLQREKAKVSKSEYLEEPSVANGGKIHLKDFYLVFLDVSSPAVPPMTCLRPSVPPSLPPSLRRSSRHKPARWSSLTTTSTPSRSTTSTATASSSS
jgi:hypothetical protein